MIALAPSETLQIVTEEKPSNSLKRPTIPYVCQALQMPPCFDLLKLIQTERRILG